MKINIFGLIPVFSVLDIYTPDGSFRPNVVIRESSVYVTTYPYGTFNRKGGKRELFNA